jgi:hypothetical protein
MFFRDLQSLLKISIVLLAALFAVTHLSSVLALSLCSATNTDWSLFIFADTCKGAVLRVILLLKHA